MKQDDDAMLAAPVVDPIDNADAPEQRKLPLEVGPLFPGREE
jgi:hypothetical protein